LEATVVLLLKHGSDVNMRDKDGWTALHWTVMKRDQLRLHLEKVRIAEALIEAGAEINPKATTAKRMQHDQPGLARRVPANATPYDILAYALPRDADLAEILGEKGGKSGLQSGDLRENGVYFQNHQEVKLSIQEFSRALLADPKASGIYVDRARAKIVLMAYDEAERDLGKAIELQPDFGEAFIERAKVRIENKKYALAEADANAALKLGFSKAESFYLRGKARMKLNMREAACEDFVNSASLGNSLGAQAQKLYCN
jgi:ankyrin repeat protein